MVPEATTARRLSRAKQKIARAGIPCRVPDVAGADLVRVTLTAEAVRLARLLAELMPDEPTVLGLLALLLLHDARRAARVGDAGMPVLLADQDRARWDREAIREGVELVGAALRRTPDRPDGCVLQAAIAACHALAPAYADTTGTRWSPGTTCC